MYLHLLGPFESFSLEMVENFFTGSYDGSKFA